MGRLDIEVCLVLFADVLQAGRLRAVDLADPRICIHGGESMEKVATARRALGQSDLALLSMF